MATYETDTPVTTDFPAEDASAAARGAYDLEYEHAVCAAGVARTEAGFETAIVNDD